MEFNAANIKLIAEQNAAKNRLFVRAKQLIQEAAEDGKLVVELSSVQYDEDVKLLLINAGFQIKEYPGCSLFVYWS